MTKENFKKLCSDVFKEYGFRKYKTVNYYRLENDVAIFLELQKSNFCNAYYINTYYYKIGKEIESISIPQLYNCTADEYLRMIMWSDSSSTSSKERKVTSMIRYEDYDAETLEFYIRQHFDVYVNTVFKNGYKYIEDNMKYFRSPKYSKFLLMSPQNEGRKHSCRKVIEKIVKIEVYIWDKLRSVFGKHIVKLRFMEKTRKKRLGYMLLLSVTYVAWRIVSLNDIAPLIGNSNGKMSLADPVASLLMGVFLLLFGKHTEKGKWRNALFVVGFFCIAVAIAITILAVLEC